MKYISILILCLLVATTTNAQLGGLFNKAKGAVKSKAQEVITEPAKKQDNGGSPSNAGQQNATPSSSGSSGQQGSSSSGSSTANSTPPFTPTFELPEGDKYRVPADPYTCPIHTANIGKVVFSNQRMVAEACKESAVKSTFQVDEPLYAKVFLKTCAKNYVIYDKGLIRKDFEYINDYGKYHVRFYIDGNLLGPYKQGKNDKEKAGLTAWVLVLSGRGADAKESYTSLITEVNKLADGMHTVKVVVFAGESETSSISVRPIAEGEFTINKPAGKKMKFGYTWASFKEGMVNAALTKQAVEVANARAEKEQWQARVKYAKIKSTEWKIIRNPRTGIILSRTIQIQLYVVSPNGRIEMQNFEFIQPNTGGNTYAQTITMGVLIDSQDIDGL